MTAVTKVRAGEGYIYTLSLSGKELGYATVSDHEVIERLDIVDDEQGKGYGTYLLQYISQDIGNDLVIVPDNARCVSLYARLGRAMDDAEYDRYGWALDQGHGVYVI